MKKATISMQTKSSLVLKRFESGDCVVNSSGRHFWVNNENLLRAVSADETLEAVSADEMQGLEELVRMKIITKLEALPIKPRILDLDELFIHLG